jgi:hypothetical protein
MKRAAGVTLAIAAVIAAMFFGEAGNPFAIAPLAFGVALSIAIAFLLDSRRLVRAGIGLAAIAIYVGVFALGLVSFGRAFNECVDVGESVRRQVEAFRAIHGAYPENLSRLEGPMPCALVTRPSVLMYERTSTGYAMRFADWLVEHVASNTEPFSPRK